MDATGLASGKSAAQFLAAFGRVIATRRLPSGVAMLPEALASKTLSSRQLERGKNSVGRLQFGTLGGGNHSSRCKAMTKVASGRWPTPGPGVWVRQSQSPLVSMAANTGLRYLTADNPADHHVLDVAWRLNTRSAIAGSWSRREPTSLRDLQRLLRDLDHEKQMAVNQARLFPWR